MLCCVIRAKKIKMTRRLQLATFLWLLTLALVQCKQSEVTSTTRLLLKNKPKLWIFPILRWGPNNQKRDLRHALAQAKELEAGLILTGLFKHYRDEEKASTTKRRSSRVTASLNEQQQLQSTPTPSVFDANSTWVVLRKPLGTENQHDLPPCFSEPVKNFMPFDEVMDRAAIEKWVPTATVDELVAEGWNGKIEALVHRSNSFLAWNDSNQVTRALTAGGVSIAEGAPQITFKGTLNCDQDRIDMLKEQIQPYRYIGMQALPLGPRDTFDLEQEARGPASDSKCDTIVHQANLVLKPAAWLTRVARAYIQEVFGDETFMAVHVRPYPDLCLDRWKWGKLQPEKMKKACIKQHADLHQKVGPCISKAFQQAGVSNLFIMTHPAIRTQTGILLKEAGVTNAVFLDDDLVTRIAGCQDETASYLALVEEQIAVESTVFVGTATSSATHTIAYERISLGRLKNEYLETMQC